MISVTSGFENWFSVSQEGQETQMNEMVAGSVTDAVRALQRLLQTPLAPQVQAIIQQLQQMQQ